MKPLNLALLLLAGSVAAGASLLAFARGSHSGGHSGGGYDSLYRSEHISSRSVSVAGPVFAPWYPAPPYWYYEQTVAVPAYIERDPASADAAQPQYWYFCKAAKIYYPYIGECPAGWQAVAPKLPRS
jgi:hypothetical protein